MRKVGGVGKVGIWFMEVGKGKNIVYYKTSKTCQPTHKEPTDTNTCSFFRKTMSSTNTLALLRTN